MVAPVFSVGRLVAGLPAGIWAERVGEHRLMAAGALASIVGSALCAWSPVAAIRLLGRLVQGPGSGCW